MLNIILFNKAQSPDLSLFDDLLFREKWKLEKLPDNCFLVASPCDSNKKGFKIEKIYKTHDSLGRPIPKRDINGKFIKND